MKQTDNRSKPQSSSASERLPLKTILCDMGNVLVFFCHDRMCRQIGELCGRSGAEIRKHLIDSELQWDFERGFVDEDTLHVRLEELLATRLDRARLVHAVGDIFDLNFSIVPVLDALKARGLRLVLLSNTCITHYNYVSSHFDVLDRFDHLVLSYEAGAMKPEDGIYEAALKEIDCRPEECLYLDDIPAYVEKGRTYGLNAEVFTTTENLLKDLLKYDIDISIESRR